MNFYRSLWAFLSLLCLGCQPSEWQTITFPSTDELTITADLYETGNKSDPLIVMFHQSASSRGEYRKIAPALRDWGFNCLAVDLRWGKQDFWDKVPNQTAALAGSVAIIDNYQDTDEYRQTEVWPRMWASVNDMNAALQWAKEAGFNGKTLTWGSSFSAMLQFKQAAEMPSQVDGIISFSPGEYNAADTSMLSEWAKSASQPALIMAGSDTSEYQMTRPVFELLQHNNSRHHWVKQGRHGSSMIWADTVNWTPVWQFLHQFRDYKAMDYLSYARETEKWLNNNATEQGGHLVWPDAVDAPDNVSVSYSDGMAGKLAFYLELYKATRDREYLEEAGQIGDYLAQHLPQKTDSLKGKFWAFSPYGSVCGPAFALTELYKVTGEETYQSAANEVIEVLDFFADRAADSLSWDLGNDVLGGLSGTGLFLLYAHKELGSEKALEMAVGAGKTLLSRAITDGEGLTWKRGQNSRFILPNFSHGPAGVGYFLASLYEATGDEQFMQAALKAVKYLDSIAKTDDGVYLIPYGFPDPGWSRAYDVGWAHGPAGVARFYIKLHQITKDDRWLRKAEACYNGIIRSNPMGQPHPDFGTERFSIDQRFGLAGVASFAQDMYAYTGEHRYLELSELLVNHILSKAESIDGLHWPMARFGFMANAGQITTFTGLFYGSTGFGKVLLTQHNLLAGKQKAIRFVDDPFAQEMLN